MSRVTSHEALSGALQRRGRSWLACQCLWLVLAAGLSQAQTPDQAPGQAGSGAPQSVRKAGLLGPFDAITLHTGQGVDHNLLDLPGALARGRLRWEQSKMTALSLGRDGGRLGDAWQMLAGSTLASWRHGQELVLAQHRGLQHNAELGAAQMLRSPTLKLGPAGVRFATGLGLSYALGTPTYEDGPADDPQRRYRLQLLALFELEWRWLGAGPWSVTTRVHHRSGVYGLIAPPRVGSNFLALGLRVAL